MNVSVHVIPPLLLGVFLLWLGGYLWWHLVERRLTVLTPGEVMRSAAMKPGALRRAVRRHGLRAVIDLRKDDEGEVPREAETLKELGCKHLRLPSTQVPNEELRDRFLELIGDPENRPALIHCTHGEGRAVLYGALWLIEFQGLEPEAARRKARWITTRGSTFDLKRDKGKYLHDYTRVRG